jgi:hypothetical protein
VGSVYEANQREDDAVEALTNRFHGFPVTKRLESTRRRDPITRTFFGFTGRFGIDELLAPVRRTTSTARRSPTGTTGRPRSVRPAASDG